MSKIYKGYELLKAIADEEIKNDTKIEIKGRFSGDLMGSYFIYNKGAFKYNIYTPENKIYEELLIRDILNYEFKIIEDEVDIDNIEEIKLGTVCDARDLIINTLVQAVKQLNKEIKGENK